MKTIHARQRLSLLLTITFLFSTQQLSQAADAIDINQIFTDNGTTLISSGGTYELGFYTPQNSMDRYVGIWYKKITVHTVVWVANRETPLVDTSGTLRVIEPGRLVLLNSTNDIIWSTDASRTAKNPVAQLLDTGNLVVKDANDDDNPENFLWQSFNHPTDTLLPGMKLGWNFRTGLEVYLTSPKSSNDPASGAFTFHCDPTGYPQQVMRQGASVLFKSGPWIGVRFSGSPNFNKDSIYTFGVVINKNEVFYYTELIRKSLYTRLTLSESGVAKRWVWHDQAQGWGLYLILPVDNCDSYNTCGPFGSCNTEKTPICGCLNKFEPKDPHGWDKGDWSNGCVRSTPLNCHKDGFLKFSGVKLPDTQNSWYDNRTTLKECRILCSKNCSCTSYSSLDISRGGSGCLLWFGDLVNMRDRSSGQEIYIRVASSELAALGGRKREIVILCLVAGVVVLSLSLILYFLKRMKRETSRLRLDYVESQKDLDLPFFDMSTITRATDNFSAKNKLGEGGFGPVYKGQLEERQEIAVKRLSRTSHQGIDEFKNEVICIAKLQHRNLVKLLGCCTHGEEMMLVYEYMTNKSLDLMLFDPTKSILLDWPRRFNIIIGIARAVLYLHQDSRLRVIHRDLKTSNILLDSDMNPKISDFGLARTFGDNETGAITKRLAGTYGYLSPEYATYGMFSVKSDVFSFGVIVLEIVTGKRNNSFSYEDHHLNLLGHAWMLYREERTLELVDSSLRNTSCLTEIQRSIHIGLLCVQEYPEDRPNMSSIVLMLSNDCVLPEAKNPGFFTSRHQLKMETSVSSNPASSSNTMSITQLQAR